jgi:S-adenosylmethionine hydrolase
VSARVQTMNPSGVVTITTDLGNKGPFLATMKGVILKHFPQARLIDLTHDTFVHWPAEAGFWLEHSYRYFPTGTVHLAVVDPGGTGDTEVIAVVREGHAFLGPDNGLLAGVVGEAGDSTVYRVDTSKLDYQEVSSFPGRDLLAPLAADLASGRTRPHELGPLTTETVPSVLPEPEGDAKHVKGTILAIDPFGNLISNIGRQLVERFERPTISAGGRNFELRRSYAEIPPGDYAALINSFDTLEIARSQQSAAEGLGLGRGAPVIVTEEPS